MAKFMIECPVCGRYAQAKNGFFAKKRIDCSCGNVIDVRTDAMTSCTCPHCGNDVVFDQSKGGNAKCPVCREPINLMDDQTRSAQFHCRQCGVLLHASRAAENFTCPVCDAENNVAERIKAEEIRNAGLASVLKYEGDADTLVWKHPIEDFNLGSRLIVHESQEALFFRNGQALDLFGEGVYTLETEMLPLLDKLYKLPFNSTAPFHSEVYFINKTSQMAVKWGTADKVNIIDPLSGAPMAIGASGLLNFRVADSRRLLNKLVGTTSGLTRQELLDDSNSNISRYFRSVVQLEVSTYLAEVITEQKIDLLQIDRERKHLSDALIPLLQPSFAEYGVEITEFLVRTILLPQRGELGYDSLQTIIGMRQKDLTKSALETEAEVKLAELEAQKQVDIRRQQNAAEVEAARRGLVEQQGTTSVLEAQLEGQKRVASASADVAADRLRMELEMERKAQTARIEAEEMRMKGYNQKDVLQADVMKTFGAHPGEGSGSGMTGLAGDAMRMGMGFATMGATMNMASDMLGNGMQTGQMLMNQQTSPASVSGTWNCPNCGFTSITSKFCPDCGTKRPEPQPAAISLTWDCPACGAKGITSKFCPECGAKRPAVQSATWDCPNCGTKGINAKFCPECGTKRSE